MKMRAPRFAVWRCAARRAPCGSRAAPLRCSSRVVRLSGSARARAASSSCSPWRAAQPHGLFRRQRAARVEPSALTSTFSAGSGATLSFASRGEQQKTPTTQTASSIPEHKNESLQHRTNQQQHITRTQSNSINKPGTHARQDEKTNPFPQNQNKKFPTSQTPRRMAQMQPRHHI